MGNSQSIRKINYEDVQYVIKNSEIYLIINTLNETEQECLIPNTIKFKPAQCLIALGFLFKPHDNRNIARNICAIIIKNL